ncbi:hypothetical protein B0F90DRAFT_1955231 [Multifurca ochricompacta]|uniref:Uncharacterized protein n=1 Tax=Multifurca ochricompacta TaxID=376703 RepID=A0AAD4LX16_9AGAM|nr:hypothetical protein B0F90DRAFT_1955231 [Multifurca ochricompacta]
MLVRKSPSRRLFVLQKHLHSNTVSRNLWEGINEETGLDIPRLGIPGSQKWVPVITVIETPTGVKVRQDRFLEDGPAKLKDNETTWWGGHVSMEFYDRYDTTGLFHWVKSPHQHHWDRQLSVTAPYSRPAKLSSSLT